MWGCPTYSPLETMKWDAKAFGTAISNYERSEGKLPSAEGGLELLVGKYIARNPGDPWGGNYKYAVIEGEESGFVIWSDSAFNELGYQVKIVYTKVDDGYTETVFRSVSP